MQHKLSAVILTITTTKIVDNNYYYYMTDLSRAVAQILSYEVMPN